MSAKTSVSGELLEEEILAANGLRQGCTLAPTLCNLCSCLVMDRACDVSGGCGDLHALQI